MAGKIKRAIKKMEVEQIKREMEIEKSKPADHEKVMKVIKSDIKPIMVPVEKLRFDTKYQYSPTNEPGREAQLKKYLEARGGYDVGIAGGLQANLRKDGFYWVMDGYGRFWMATKLVETPVKEMSVFPHEGLNLNEEIEVFTILNKHKRTIKRPRLFMAAALRGSEPEKTISKIVEAAGYAIERLTHKKGAQIAETALLFAYNLDTELLKRALFILRNTWGDHIDGRHVVAVSAILHCYPEIDEGRLRHVMKMRYANAAIKEARDRGVQYITARTLQSRDVNPFMAKQLIDWYNSNLKGKGKRLSYAGLRIIAEQLAFEQYKDVWNHQYAI